MARQVEIEYKAHKYQAEFRRRPERFRALLSGIGGGKTYAGAMESIETMLTHPDSHGMIAAPTYPMLRDATQRTFMELLPKEVILENKLTEKTLTLVNGAVVNFRSADDPEKMRGPNLGWIWLDEGRLMPGMAWDIAIGRLRELPERAWVTSTTKGRDWQWEVFVDMPGKKPHIQKDYWYCTYSTDANPNLSESFVESIKNRYTGSFLEQEFYAKFVAFEGLVYSDFTREMNVIKECPKDLTYYGLFDFGFTNPGVILAMGVDHDGRAYIVDEIYKAGMTPGVYVSEALRFHNKYNFADCAADPSSPDYIRSLNEAGIPVYGSQNAIMEGISLVSSRIAAYSCESCGLRYNRFLNPKEFICKCGGKTLSGDGRPRLYVHQQCVNTINEFEQYMYPERKLGKQIQEKPIKVYDHAMDCIRYGCFLLEQMKRGMKVIGSMDDLI